MDETKNKLDRQLKIASDMKEDIEDEKTLIKVQKAFEREIVRVNIESIANMGLIYGLTALSFWYLSEITYFMIAYVFSVTFLFAYVLFLYQKLRKARKQDYQELLKLCKIPKGRHEQ